MSNQNDPEVADKAVQPPADQKTQPDTQTTKRSFYKRPVFFGILILLIAGVVGLLYSVKYKPQKKNTDPVRYVTGLPLNHAAVQIPYDQDLERYPLLKFTVGGINVYLNTFEGLTVLRGTKMEPGLAESWTNPDSLTWRFKIRKNVQFQSGDPLTAKDVKFTIDKAKASEKDEVPWVSQPMAARIDTVQVIDDFTVDLKTKEPDATLLSWLVYLGIVSQEQITRDGVKNAVGTGPYKIVSIAKREAKLEANDTYWNGKPKLQALTYRVIFEPQKAKKALENNTLDIITINALKNNDLQEKGYLFANVRTGGIDWVFFDVNSQKSKYVTGTDKNPFKDVRVRKAIQLALDVPELISETGLNAEPVTQFATQELVGYNPELTYLRTNLTDAKKLLADAGFPDGFTVILDTDQQAEHVKAVRKIKKQLAELGITVTVNTPEINQFYEKLFAGDFSMLFTSYFPDTIDSLDLIDSLFHSKTGSHGASNMNNYANQELNAILNQARSTYDEGQRIKFTRQAHALIMQDIPSLPLYTETYQIFSRNTITYKPSLSAILLGFDMSGRGLVK